MRRNTFSGLGFIIVLAFVTAGVSAPHLSAQENPDVFKVGLAVLKDNPDYLAAREAFVGALEQDQALSFEFISLDAGGDQEVYKQGLQKWVDEDQVNLVFTTGTVSTQPAVEIIKDIPVVFTAVADPVRAGIVDNLEAPGGNVTGTHCAVPAQAQILTIKKTFPDVKTIGIVYTDGEPNAEIQARDFKIQAKQFNIETLTATIPPTCESENEVADAAKTLVGKVDVLVGLQDTSISKYGKGMLTIAAENKIPTYVSLGHLLSEGAVCSLNINFKSIGALAGGQAKQILKEHTRPGDIPVVTDRDYSLSINLSAAKAIGVTLSPQILRTASKIIE